MKSVMDYENATFYVGISFRDPEFSLRETNFCNEKLFINKSDYYCERSICKQRCWGDICIMRCIFFSSYILKTKIFFVFLFKLYLCFILVFRWSICAQS